MSIEYLKMIKEQETEADEIRHTAYVDSKQFIADAKKTAANTIDKARAEADDLSREIIAKAEDEARIDYDNTIHRAEWECDMIWSKAEKNLDLAVSIIMKRVLG